MVFNNLPVLLLAESHTQRIATDASKEKHRSDEARESNGSDASHSTSGDSCGGRNFRGILTTRQRGRPRLPDDQATPSAIRMRLARLKRVVAPKPPKIKKADREPDSCDVRTVCDSKLIREFQIAAAYFWAAKPERGGVEPIAWVPPWDWDWIAKYANEGPLFPHRAKRRGH